MIPAYERDPAAIYRKSFETIRAEAALDRFDTDEKAVAIRLIHACGMVDLAEDLLFSGQPVSAARAALTGPCTLFCDVEMVAAGIIAKRLPPHCDVVVTLNDDRTPDLARSLNTTRSAAAVDLWQSRLANSIAVIGNAPTALFRLLESIVDGGPRPAAILALPVGFVGAAESKQALIDLELDVPYITVRGRRGGSAMASAAVNGIVAGLIEEQGTGGDQT